MRRSQNVKDVTVEVFRVPEALIVFRQLDESRKDVATEERRNMSRSDEDKICSVGSNAAPILKYDYGF